MTIWGIQNEGEKNMKVFRHHDDKRRTKNLGRTFLMVFEKETRHVFKGEELHPSTHFEQRRNDETIRKHYRGLESPEKF